ncbi:MAG TPA: pitrilysin family protein [Candidatus Paceibacterota bacterium]|nr:pitrilysin family protein [Candidatus Paceibacterota bacterium]
MIYKKTTLKNGLRVITIPEEDSLAVAVFVLVEAGSKYEKKEINGLSHFLEHMCFKGTKTRPTALDISSELDSLGAQFNAFTSQEFTGYYAKVAANHFDKALDIVSDLYLNPVIDSVELEKEKGVIVEEINMYEDLPQHRVQDLILEALYGDQPAGWNIAGDKETVRKFDRETFLKYRGEHYVSSATTVVVAGNFNEEKAIKDIEEKFKGMHSGEKHGKLAVIEAQKAPLVLTKKKESDQTHLVLAVRTFSATDKRNHTIDVLSQVLGGGMSSRLFQKVREEMGAAYYVRCSNNTHTDHGFLEASAGADNKRAKEVISAIVAEFARMKNELPTEKELNRAKESLIGNMFLSLETSDAIAGHYGLQEVIKREIEEPEEYAKKIRAVTGEEVMTVAKEIFRQEHLNLALIGPAENKDDFVSLLKL